MKHKFEINIHMLLFLIIILSLTLLCLAQLILYILISPEPPTKDYVLLWWTPFMLGKDKIMKCGAHKCLLSDDKKYYNDTDIGALLFYGSILKLYDLPLPKGNLPWAIYHEESPKNFPFFLYKKGQSLFDIISTFDRYSHFPTTLQHLDDIELLTELKYFVPLDIKNKQVIAPVLYLQSGCQTPSQRDLYVQELMKYIPIDSYGTCLNNKQLPDYLKMNGTYDVYEEKLMKFVARYKFTIAIENSVCTDYITEKLWRPLIVGSVPLYLGSPTIKDWLPNNKSAILIDEFKDMKTLAKYLHTLNDDDKLYSEYLAHKLSKNEDEKITNSLLISTMSNHKATSVLDFACFVCNFVNSKESPKKSGLNLYDCPRPTDHFNTDNTWKQHWDLGKCQNKALDDILINDKFGNYSEDGFHKLALENLMINDC